jgi:hypothetical protein
MTQKKTVTILASSKNGFAATNATSRNVWKKIGNSYVFSHVENLKPTHTLDELITPPKPAQARNKQ